MALGTDFALRLAEVRSPAQPARPRPDPGAGDRRPGQAETGPDPAEIRALAAEAIAHLHQVAGKLAELPAQLGDDEAGEGRP